MWKRVAAGEREEERMGERDLHGSVAKRNLKDKKAESVRNVDALRQLVPQMLVREDLGASLAL